MDDGVQRGEVQVTTCRKNKQNEGVYNGRKYSWEITGERHIYLVIFEWLCIFGGHLGFLRLYKIAQAFASGTQRIWIQQVEIMKKRPKNFIYIKKTHG